MRSASSIILALLLTSFAAFSQTEKPAAADIQALRDARNVADPQAKITALRNFIKTHPKSSRIDAANNLLLETLVKNFPSRTADINKQASTVLKHAKGLFRMYDYQDVASTLADGNVLLPRAAHISQKSLKMLHEKSYAEDMRKAYAQAKMKPPNETKLHRYYLEAHSQLQATLGRIYLKQDKTEEGEALLKSAYADDPSNSVAAAGLGELAAKTGKDNEALTYLTTARLTGKLDNNQQQLLQTLYTKTHSGSMAGFENYLDQRYAALFPPPFEPAKYKALTKPSGRIVLAELFTGSGCAPCSGADLAIDAELERYSRKQLAVLAFDQHIPEPDPLAIPAGVKRFEFYNAHGTPTLALDGTTKIIGADRDASKERFEEINKLVDADLQSSPEANLSITAHRDGGLVTVHAFATNVKGASKDIVLQIALVEDRLRYSGENGIRFHPMVVRSLANGQTGFPVVPDKPYNRDYTFDTQKISSGLKTYLNNYEKSNDRFGSITFIQKMDVINPADLSIVAFLQDTKTKHVLQAAYFRVNDSQ